MTDHLFRKIISILTSIIMMGSSALATEAETPVEAEPVACAHAGTQTREEAGKAATCTENGSHVMITVCADCGAELSRQTMTDLALGHEYTETGRKQPTCTEAGSVTYTCLRCGNSYTEASGATIGHAFQETGRKAPTCTEGGSITYSCSQCGLSYTEAFGDPSGHDYRETGRQEATSEQEGLITYTCSLCGEIRTEAIPKTAPAAPLPAEPEPAGSDPTTPPQSTENQTGSASSESGETPETNDPTPTPGDAPAEPAETANSDETGTDGNGDQPVTAPQNDAPEQAGGETGSTEITDPEEQKTEKPEETPDEKEDHPETKKEDTEEKKEEILPEEPFEQQESLGGILITVTSEPGVLEAGTKLSIRSESNGDFIQAVETVLGLDKDENKETQHQLISISGAAAKGNVQITLQGLGFRKLLQECPEGSLSVQVLRYYPEGGSASAKAILLPARVNQGENSVSFRTEALGLFDVVAVVTAPETEEQKEPAEEDKNVAKETEEETEELQDIADEKDSVPDPKNIEENIEEQDKPGVKGPGEETADSTETEETVAEAGEFLESADQAEGKVQSSDPDHASEENAEDASVQEEAAGEAGSVAENRETAEENEQGIDEAAEGTKADGLSKEASEEDLDDALLEAGQTIIEETFLPEANLDNTQLLENFMQRKLPGYGLRRTMKARSAAGVQAAGSSLKSGGKALYDFLGDQIIQVAEGNLQSTIFTWDAASANCCYYVPAEDIKGCPEKPFNNQQQLKKDTVNAVLAFHKIILLNVFEALISDYPYDLYWVKNNEDFIDETDISYQLGADNHYQFCLNSITVKIPVSEAFQAGGLYQFNTDLPARVNGAASRINRLTETYANRNMLGKVTGFKQEICNLAAPDTGSGQQDSEIWQLVYVFDGDPDTNVQSEGYAKAFKYLCDLSSIACITVTGNIQGGSGSGTQMWNVVRMDDNNYYLADIFNCDHGNAGEPGQLFLRGYSQKNEYEHEYTLSNGQIVIYTPDENSQNAYDSIWLGWSHEDYGTTVSAHTVEISESEHGRVEATPNLAEAGTTVQLTILPDAGYELDSWSVTNQSTQSLVTPAEGTGYSFVMPDADVTVAAVFRQIAAPQFTNHSLVLTGMVGVDFYLTLPEGKTIADYDGAYVIFSGNKINSTTQHPLSEASEVSGMYKFTAFITSIQMADPITPTLHYTENGEEKTVTGTPYSAEDYIQWAASNGSLTTRQTRIVKGLADYGYYAQRFLSTQNGWTLGTDYAEMSTHFTDSYDELSIKQAAAASAFSRTANSQIVETVQYRMNMGSQITLTVRMAPKEGQTIENVMLNGTVAEKTVSGAYTMVSVPNILATRLADTSTIIVGDCEIRVSPMSYVYDVLSKSGSAQRIRTFMCALYQYGQACN